MNYVELQVTNEFGAGSQIINIVVKLKLYETFKVSTITNGDEQYFQDHINGFFKKCKILKVTTEVQKYVKLTEFIFVAKVELNVEDFKSYLQENYSHFQLRRPQSASEKCSFLKKLTNYCNQAFCGEFGMWKVEISNNEIE